MAQYILKEDLDKVFQTFNQMLGQLPIYEGPAPQKPIPPPEFLYVPAKTESEALYNCDYGYLIDGVTKSTDFQETLDQRKALVKAWWNHPNLVGIQDALKKWGIMVGTIKANDLSVGGNPIAPSSYQPPRTLQDEVDAVNNPHDGGPSGG